MLNRRPRKHFCSCAQDEPKLLPSEERLVHVERGQSRLAESGAIVRTSLTDSAVDAARALEGSGAGNLGSGGGGNGKGGATRAGLVLNVFYVHLANNVNEVSTSGRQLVASSGMLGAPRTCSPTIGTLRCPQHSILILISHGDINLDYGNLEAINSY